jgi:hypothetical protein
LKVSVQSAWARAARFALHVQGWVYVTTGLWPVVHLASFEYVTGEKYDDFLVHTAGLLLFVIGASLLRALHAGRPLTDVVRVSAGAAASLLAIDVVYFLNGRLPPIYLLDAAAEFVFLAAGIVSIVVQRRAPGSRPAT